MWYVIGLVWIAAMVGIVYAYQRKQQRRGAERAREMAALLADLKANPRVASGAANITVAPVAAAARPEFNKKPRLLPQATALLYYVFRTGLPDHEIFAGLALSDVLEVAAGASGMQREHILRKLGQHRLDLVVCTKQLDVIAVVVGSNSAPGAQITDAQFANRCLQAAGVRVVSIDPAAPPRHHQVRTLIYG